MSFLGQRIPPPTSLLVSMHACMCMYMFRIDVLGSKASLKALVNILVCTSAKLGRSSWPSLPVFTSLSYYLILQTPTGHCDHEHLDQAVSSFMHVHADVWCSANVFLNVGTCLWPLFTHYMYTCISLYCTSGWCHGYVPGNVKSALAYVTQPLWPHP